MEDKKEGKMKILLLFLISTLCGCMAGETVLLHNQHGDIAKCEVTAGDAQRGGYLNKKKTLKNCVKAYKLAGYESY